MSVELKALSELWIELKKSACRNPVEAQMIVFLTKAKFNDAMGRWLTRYGIQDKNDSQGLETPAYEVLGNAYAVHGARFDDRETD